MLPTYTVEHEGSKLEIEIYPKEMMEELKTRIRTGNQKLNDAWEQLKEMDHNLQTWRDAFWEWHLANVKLSHYCDQLKNMGYEDCLYIENGKKTKSCLEGLSCRVCPSKKPYWEKELMDLPSQEK